MQNTASLKEKVRHLPSCSGVYIMKDALGSVIYIGKAHNLKKRVSQYFMRSSRQRASNPKIASLIASIRDFDFTQTRSEAEAIILESKLIKRWKPRYNTLEKDDKNFLLLRVETFLPLPRFALARHRKDDGALYFGPYLGTTALRRALSELKKRFGILLYDARPKKIENKNEWILYDDARAEISNFSNSVTVEEYAVRVEKALEFLRGKSEGALLDAEKKMLEASEKMDFERAAKYRDLISAINETRRGNANRKFDLSRTAGEVAELAMKSLKKTLSLKKLPHSIECFDISHISGSFCVASMVRFESGIPANKKYRRFKIKTFEGNDDYRSMREVVGRRYKRLFSESPELFPDFILIDGGKGQVFSALQAFDEEGLKHPPIAGLAEKEETIITETFAEIKLPHSDEGLKLLQRVRDEAHRFANSFSGELRIKKIRESILDDFGGLGAKRKAALLKKFGSISKIKNASAEELAQTEGIGKTSARALREFLDGIEKKETR